jgi:hypothetical protein
VYHLALGPTHLLDNKKNWNQRLEFSLLLCLVPLVMTVKYYLSSRFPIDLISLFEIYLKCLNAVRENSISKDTQIVICLPSENEKILQLIPKYVRVSIVSPLWVISSIIFKSLQPVVSHLHLPRPHIHWQEFYSTSPQKIFSGIILSFGEQRIQNSQKLSAYASYLRHYGGQVYEKNFSFHTHQYLSSEDLFLATDPDPSHETNQSFNAALIRLYAYFLSSFYLSSSSASTSGLTLSTASPGPSSLPLFPISVTGLWIESSLQNSSYLSSTLLASSLHKAFWSSSPHTLSDLILAITQVFSVSHYFMSLQDMKDTSLLPLSWDSSLSDCAYLPLLPTLFPALFRHQHQQQKQQEPLSSHHLRETKLFPEKSYFLISPQYSYGLRENMKEVIRSFSSAIFGTQSPPLDRYLGGVLVPSITALPSFSTASSKISLYLISRDTTCPFLASLTSSSSNSTSSHLSILYSISHHYLYSCLVYHHILPLTPFAARRSWSQVFDHETILANWKILYPSTTQQRATLTATQFYLSLSILYSPLYYPPTLPLSSTSLCLPDMNNCVVSLSGYRDASSMSSEEGQRQGEDPLIILDNSGERYGRRELKQAIRLSGACYSGPLLRS